MDKSRKVILASCICISFLTGIFACSVEEVNVEKKGAFVCKTLPGCMPTEAQAKSNSSAQVGVCMAMSEYTSAFGSCSDDRRCAATADNSCLNGSVCIAVDPDKSEGRCVLIDEVDHCYDNDGDGYYSADPGYDDTCGFTSSAPKDCNDNDSMINAKATEFCNGKDDTCDGCVDGICPTTGCDESGHPVEGGTLACDCSSDQSICKPLTELCFGAGTPEGLAGYEKNVCSPKIGGVLYCDNETDAKTVYATCIDDKCDSKSSYKLTEKTSCPAFNEKGDVAEISYNGETIYYTYDQLAKAKDKSDENWKAKYCSGWDNDCNGIVNDTSDDGLACPQSCAALLSEERCYVYGGQITTVTNSMSISMYEAFESSHMTECYGKNVCKEEVGTPTCVRIDDSTTPLSASASCDLKD